MQLSSVNEKKKQYLQWSAEKRLRLYILSQYLANKVNIIFAIFVPVLTTFCELGLKLWIFSVHFSDFFSRPKLWVDITVTILFPSGRLERKIIARLFSRTTLKSETPLIRSLTGQNLLPCKRAKYENDRLSVFSGQKKSGLNNEAHVALLL